MEYLTAKERMLAGEHYNCLDDELESDRKKVKSLLRKFNASQNSIHRKALLHKMLGATGINVVLWPPFYCSYGKNIYLGDNVFINYLCVILDNNAVRIGNHVMIGPAVQIYTAAHDLQAESRNQGWEVARPVTIDANVWIGGGAILLPGIRIGQNAVVGAGSVVTKDVPPNTVVAGNPARVIKEIDQRLHESP